MLETLSFGRQAFWSPRKGQTFTTAFPECHQPSFRNPSAHFHIGFHLWSEPWLKSPLWHNNNSNLWVIKTYIGIKLTRCLNSKEKNSRQSLTYPKLTLSFLIVKDGLNSLLLCLPKADITAVCHRVQFMGHQGKHCTNPLPDLYPLSSSEISDDNSHSGAFTDSTWWESVTGKPLLSWHIVPVGGEDAWPTSLYCEDPLDTKNESSSTEHVECAGLVVPAQQGTLEAGWPAV